MEHLKASFVGWLVILACYFTGEFLVLCFGIRLPGALVGILLLLALLLLRKRPLNRLNYAALPLLKHMSVLFVPAVIGAAAYKAVIVNNAVGLVLAIVLSTVVALGLSASFTQFLLRKRG